MEILTTTVFLLSQHVLDPRTSSIAHPFHELGSPSPKHHFHSTQSVFLETPPPHLSTLRLTVFVSLRFLRPTTSTSTDKRKLLPVTVCDLRLSLWKQGKGSGGQMERRKVTVFNCHSTNFFYRCFMSSVLRSRSLRYFTNLLVWVSILDYQCPTNQFNYSPFTSFTLRGFPFQPLPVSYKRTMLEY